MTGGQKRGALCSAVPVRETSIKAQINRKSQAPGCNSNERRRHSYLFICPKDSIGRKFEGAAVAENCIGLLCEDRNCHALNPENHGIWKKVMEIDKAQRRFHPFTI